MIQFIVAQYEIHRQIYDKFDPTELNYRYSDKWEIKKFAGKLKQIVSLLTGIPVADLEKQSVKESILGPEWSEPGLLPDNPLAQMSVRTLLQRIGTEAMRDRVHQNIWINGLFADYKPIGGTHYFTGIEDNGIKETAIEPVYPNWIISDLRFPNEFKAIKDRGGICIRINRGKEYWNDPEWLAGKKVYSQPISLHPSETALDNAEFDYIINNSGTLEELLEQVRTMLLHFKIIT